MSRALERPCNKYRGALQEHTACAGARADPNTACLFVVLLLAGGGCALASPRIDLALPTPFDTVLFVFLCICLGILQEQVKEH